MTIFGHDPFSWPHLIIAQRSIFKGSIKPKEQMPGALLDQGYKLLLRTSDLYFILITRRCPGLGSQPSTLYPGTTVLEIQLLINYQ
jgi:hypothetical protein